MTRTALWERAALFLLIVATILIVAALINMPTVLGILMVLVAVVLIAVAFVCMFFSLVVSDTKPWSKLERHIA